MGDLVGFQIIMLVDSVPASLQVIILYPTIAQPLLDYEFGLERNTQAVNGVVQNKRGKTHLRYF